MSIFNVIKKAFQWTLSHPSETNFIATVAIPKVVRTIDDWISSAAYEQAKANVKEIEDWDSTKLLEIYLTRKDDMSMGVKRAFEEELHAQGKL